MTIHIENVHISLSGLPAAHAGMIATLFSATKEQVEPQADTPTQTGVPQINEKWPSTEAVYAGISLSSDGQRAVHLLLWPGALGRMTHERAIEKAKAVNPDMESHLPTRIQYITLFQRLREHFSKDEWHWALEKTESGKAAFCQHFYHGNQNGTIVLFNELQVRAVSEIPL